MQCEKAVHVSCFLMEFSKFQAYKKVDIIKCISWIIKCWIDSFFDYTFCKQSCSLFPLAVYINRIHLEFPIFCLTSERCLLWLRLQLRLLENHLESQTEMSKTHHLIVPLCFQGLSKYSSLYFLRIHFGTPVQLTQIFLSCYQIP